MKRFPRPSGETPCSRAVRLTMDAYATWLRICDWVTALVTEGMLTDDFPEYDWRACYEWGDSPARAVSGAVTRFLSR